MESAMSFNTSLIPSAKDLLLAFPRLAHRAGSFAFYHMPDAFDSVAGKIFSGGSVIADATTRAANATRVITNMSGKVPTRVPIPDVGATAGNSWTQGVAQVSTSTTSNGFIDAASDGLVKLKNFGGIFPYLTSKWALATFLAALVLNRTQFYASSRQHLDLRWYARILLYSIPIAAFLLQTLHVLQTLKCQTSPEFPELRYKDLTKRGIPDFGGEAGFMYQLSSKLLFWEDDAASCMARRMSFESIDNTSLPIRGSISVLFSFFITLCLSQLFETLASALQGKQPVPETGMTIFEHSLAFAECEAMISGMIGLDSSMMSNLNKKQGPGVVQITRRELMQRLNAPPEVLLVCLISCFSHLSSALLAISGKRHRVRLVNTAIWSCCYMATFLWSLTRSFAAADDGVDLGILRFPTVCIVGFIPHLMIMMGILVCGFVYLFALLVTAISVPNEIAHGFTFRQRLSWAYQNLQAGVHFSSASSIRVKMSEDFYTTLLKIGFNLLTAASEAVYLNEGNRIHVAKMTWLEQKRIDQSALAIDRRISANIPAELVGDGVARGLSFTDQQNVAVGYSPYARERKSRTATGEKRQGRHTATDSGIGMTQRRSRMNLTFDFVTGIFWLLVGLQVFILQAILGVLGFNRYPNWLQRFIGHRLSTFKTASDKTTSRAASTHSFWMPGVEGTFAIPENEEIDIELETRRRIAMSGPVNEDTLSWTLYTWWRGGGWFGTLDASGDYEPEGEDDDNFDATSVISISSAASDADERSGATESGQRTPTQQYPYGFDREETPLEDDTRLDVDMLSRLLDPSNAVDREQAKLLSRSLQSSRPLTRSQYRKQIEQSRTQLVKGLSGVAGRGLSEEEEEQDLEQFILAQRTKSRTRPAMAATWDNGAEGMGAGGPLCVVCQCSPRSILVWPCGCLSMCDECRVGLAARNYTKCICCRTDIAAYSRLYVP